MTTPLTVDVPHRLGQAGARERLKARVGSLEGQMPAAIGAVSHRWAGENELRLDVTAMGQTIPACLEILDSVVRVHVELPAMLGFFSGMIGAAVKDRGTKLLGNGPA
jgi:hypothetical protein